MFEHVFYYTGGIFWLIIAMIILVGVLIATAYSIMLYFQWTYRWAGFKVMEKVGVTEQWVKDRQFLLSAYDKKDRLMIMRFVGRMNEELKND
jgi:hypothetical protein